MAVFIFSPISEAVLACPLTITAPYSSSPAYTGTPYTELNFAFVSSRLAIEVALCTLFIYNAVLLTPPILLLSDEASIFDAVSVIWITHSSLEYFEIISFKKDLLMDLMEFSSCAKSTFFI